MRGQRHHLVAGRRWSLLCSGAVLCLKASKEGIQLVQQGDGAVTGLWWGLVVRNGLNPLPQAPSVIYNIYNIKCNICKLSDLNCVLIGSLYSKLNWQSIVEAIKVF